MADALRLVGTVGQIAGFGVVGITQMGHAEHFAHGVDGGRRDAVIQLSLVTHDRIHIDDGAFGGLLHAITGNNARLKL